MEKSKKSNFEAISQQLEKIAERIEAVSKKATASKLYEYEIDGFVFFSPEKNSQGMRLPSGRAKYTRHYYSVNGQLSKEVKEEEEKEQEAAS